MTMNEYVKLGAMKYHYLLLLTFSIFLAGCSDKPKLSPLPGDAIILAFGNSLTYGTGAGREESYPAVLANIINREVINAGIPGEISKAGLERLPMLIEQYQPGLLILCHGGNDFLQKRNLEQAKRNIQNMVRLATSRNIPVVLLGVPKPGLFLNSADMYAEIADATGAIFIEDLIPDILGDNTLKSDTVHPNKAGYNKMADHIATVLKDAGAI